MDFKLSQKVETALDDIFPPKDAFERSNFQVKTFFNQVFPNEKSLSKVDEMLVRTRRRIDDVKRSLHRSIREQSLSETETIDLEQSKETINQLFTKIDSIQKKANESEKLVEQITKDIQLLDNAKKNLTLTISTLRKLHMFVKSIEQLKHFITKRDYSNIASKLNAINSFMKFFNEYSSVPKVQNLFLQVSELKRLLSNQIGKEFHNQILKEKEKRNDVACRNMCLVIDGLSETTLSGMNLGGTTLLETIRSNFLKIKMKKYQETFQKQQNVGLSKIGKRYKYMRRLLQQFVRNYGKIFPKQWCVEQELVVSFCIITHTAVKTYLSRNKKVENDIREKKEKRGEKGGGLDAVELIRAIRSTLKFEREMQASYHAETDWERNKKNKIIEEELNALRKKKNILKLNSSQNVSELYKLIKRVRELEIILEKKKKNRKDEPKEKKIVKEKPTRNYHFLGMISKTFEAHMNVYIEFEYRMMNEKINDVIKKEKWDPQSPRHSAEDLFIYIEESLNNCTTFSKGKTLFELYQDVWKPQINNYISKLEERIPKVKKGTIPFKIKMISSSNLSSGDVKKVCHIIILSNYCRGEINRTSKVLKSNIHQNFKKEISFLDETKKFYWLEKRGITSIVKNLANMVDQNIALMNKLKWENWTTCLPDHNEYISKVAKRIEEEINKFADFLKWESYKIFCSEFITELAIRFETYVYKCKKISAKGINQFLLDLASLKNYVEKIIRFHRDFEENEEYNQVFTNKVSEQIDGRVSNIFRVLMSPKNQLLKTYQTYFTKGNEDHFKKIIELKVLKKEDESNLLEKFTNVLITKTKKSLVKMKKDNKK